MKNNLPGSSELESSTLRVLSASGGSLKSCEIDNLVIADLKLTSEQLSILHSGSRSEVSYRLAWVRTKAKQKGLIERLPTNQWKLANNTFPNSTVGSN